MLCSHRRDLFVRELGFVIRFGGYQTFQLGPDGGLRRLLRRARLPVEPLFVEARTNLRNRDTLIVQLVV